MAKQLKAAILTRRAAKGPRKKRTRPKPRQYTIADWELHYHWRHGKCREPPSGVDSRLSDPACDRRSIGSRGRSPGQGAVYATDVADHDRTAVEMHGLLSTFRL
jgi:hypothetical protein